MAKRTAPHKPVPMVSCTGCIYQHVSDHPAVMWCGKIKMPMPVMELTKCVHKIKNQQ